MLELDALCCCKDSFLISLNLNSISCVEISVFLPFSMLIAYDVVLRLLFVLNLGYEPYFSVYVCDFGFGLL